jgi:alanine racemase
MQIDYGMTRLGARMNQDRYRPEAAIGNIRNLGEVSHLACSIAPRRADAWGWYHDPFGKKGI